MARSKGNHIDLPKIFLCPLYTFVYLHINVLSCQTGTFKQLDFSSWVLAKPPPLVPSEVQHTEQDRQRQMLEQLFGENLSGSKGLMEVLSLVGVARFQRWSDSGEMQGL